VQSIVLKIKMTTGDVYVLILASTLCTDTCLNVMY
jgi:hypothetical protein